MSDIRLYTAAQASSLVPLTGDVILCTEAFNSAPANSVHLCTNATGPVWKSFQNDGVAEAVPFNQYSLSFDGSDDSLTVPHDDTLSLTNEMTFSAWINMDTSLNTDYPYLISKWNGAQYNYTFYTKVTGQTAGKYTLRYFDGSSSRSANTEISKGEWAHVAATVGGGNINFYINGASAGGGQMGSGTANTGGVVIGRSPANTRAFKGLIDEVAIFNTAFSAPEIASLINTSGANPVPADISSFINNGLVAWYRMGDDANDTFVDGGSVSSITDSSGNGNTATQATASSQPTFSTSVPA